MKRVRQKTCIASDGPCSSPLNECLLPFTPAPSLTCATEVPPNSVHAVLLSGW